MCLETSFPVHSGVPPQSWELGLLPSVLYKTLFLPWWYLYHLLEEPSAFQRTHKRILPIAQLGSRKPYLLYWACLNPAGSCSTIKYIFALRTELRGNSTAQKSASCCIQDPAWTPLSSGARFFHRVRVSLGLFILLATQQVPFVPRTLKSRAETSPFLMNFALGLLGERQKIFKK